ncbi:MAG: (Na+)-NQR maturation NqrM [Bacteriovoracaceae bacterium]
MIKTILVSSLIVTLSLFGMAIGYIVAKKKLQGSCGGLGKVLGDDCMFCDKKDECETAKKKQGLS